MPILGELSGDVGLAITKSSILAMMIQWSLIQWSELETDMTHVERALEYTEILQVCDKPTSFIIIIIKQPFVSTAERRTPPNFFIASWFDPRLSQVGDLPLLLLSSLGFHSINLFVHLLYDIRATCPTHLHLVCVTH